MSGTSESAGRWTLAAALIRDCRLGWAMVIGGAAYFALVFAGVDPFPCPMLRVTGLPCPGCGMTRACLAALHGDWRGVLAQNPFGPIFALLWLVVGAGLLAPAGRRERWAAAIARFESRTRLPLWLGAALLLYTLTRWLGLC